MVSLVQDPYCFPTMIYGMVWHAVGVVNADKNIQEPGGHGQDLVRPHSLNLVVFVICEGIYCQGVRSLQLGSLKLMTYPLKRKPCHRYAR